MQGIAYDSCRTLSGGCRVGLVMGKHQHDRRRVVFPGSNRAELGVLTLQVPGQRQPRRFIAEGHVRYRGPGSVLHNHLLYPFFFKQARRFASDREDDGVPAILHGGRPPSGGKNSQYSLRFSTRQPWPSARRLIFLKSPLALMWVVSLVAGRSPRPLDVVEAQQSVGAVDDHADRIEADRVGPRTRVGVLVEPCARQLPQACALAELQPRQRLVLRTEAPAAVAGASRLDLGEHQHPPVEGDQVDLAMARSHVARHHHEPEAAEVAYREILSDGAQRATLTPRRWKAEMVGPGGAHTPTLCRKM